MLRLPGVFEGGKVVDAMTSHMDIYPTICELAGIDEPHWLRGKSLLPLAKDGAEEIHDELFFEVNYHAAYDPMRAVRMQAALLPIPASLPRCRADMAPLFAAGWRKCIQPRWLLRFWEPWQWPP